MQEASDFSGVRGEGKKQSISKVNIVFSEDTYPFLGGPYVVTVGNKSSKHRFSGLS